MSYFGIRNHSIEGLVVKHNKIHYFSMHVLLEKVVFFSLTLGSSCHFTNLSNLLGGCMGCNPVNSTYRIHGNGIFSHKNQLNLGTYMDPMGHNKDHLHKKCRNPGVDWF